MPVLPKRILTMGEVDPSKRGQVSSPEYIAGLKTQRNAITKKTGGVRNRAGLRYVGPAKSNTTTKRLVEFDFGLGDSYALIFGNNNVRVTKNQIPVRELPLAITAVTQASPGVFTSVANGLSAGDEIYLEGEDPTGMVEMNKRSATVLPIDADTFSLIDMFGVPIDTTNYTTFVGGLTMAKTYEIGSPYTPDDLAYLNYDQSFDVIKIADGTHFLQDLTRLADDNWTLGNSAFTPSISAPSGLTITQAGTASTWYVTAVKIGSGEESLSGSIQGDAPTSGAPQTLAWSANSSAFLYKVYRTDNTGTAGLIALVPAVASPSFVDAGIGPDYTKNPTAQQGTVFTFGFSLTKEDATTVFPMTALEGVGKCVAWSPDGSMIAVGHATSPYLRVYSYQSGAFTDITISAVDTAPDGTVNQVSWSPDGAYLACATSGTSKAILFKRNGLSLTTNASGYTQPTGNAFGCAWSSDSGLLAFAHATTPFVTVWDRTGDTFTKLANPSSLPPAQGNCCVFSPNSKKGYLAPVTSSVSISYLGTGQFTNDPSYSAYGSPVTTGTLFVGCNNSGGVALMMYTILPTGSSSQGLDSLTTLSGGSGGVLSQPGQNVLSCSMATNILTVGLGGGSYLKSYTMVGTANLRYGLYFSGVPIVCYVKLFNDNLFLNTVANPITLPDGAVNGLSETVDGSYVAASTAGTQKFILYDRIGYSLVIDPTQPADLDGDGAGCTFSPDGSLLAVAEATTPYVVLYGVSLVHPGAVGFGQQRLRIGNVTNGPDIEYDSAQNSFTNFTIRPLPNDSDAMSFRVEGRKLNEIMHLLQQNKLIQITTSGIIVLEGDQNGTISPDLPNPRMLGKNGGDHIRPAAVGTSFIYVGTTHNKVWDLRKEIMKASYFSSDNFFVDDLTTPSAHLFKGRRVVDMCYQETPDSVVWFVMDDGTVRSLTYVPAMNVLEPEQEVKGWGRHDMGILGSFEACCCIRDAEGKDVVYFVVALNQSQPQSPTPQLPLKVIVAMQDRDVDTLEDQFFVDAGVTYDGRQNGSTWLNCDIYTDPGLTMCDLMATTPTFTAASVGQVLRLHYPSIGVVLKAGSVDALITAYTSPTQVNVTLRNASDPSFYGVHQPVNQWSILTQMVNGLAHLQGQNVSVLVDGGVISSPNNTNLKNNDGTAASVLSVSGGVLDFSATGVWGEVVHVGLPYTCDIETLEMDAAQGDSLARVEKTVSEVWVKVNGSKGLYFGPNAPKPSVIASGIFTNLYNYDTTTGMNKGKYGNNLEVHDKVGGAVVPLIDTEIQAPIDGSWNKYGRVFIRQADPLPVEIVGIFPATAI